MRNAHPLGHVLDAITPADLSASSDNVLLFANAVGQPLANAYVPEDPMAAFADRTL